jgi:hypothetical protein
MFRYLVLLVFLLGLGATAALAQSDADVKLVQKKLADYGAGKANGKMGNKTRNAIRAYQKDWQIQETGEITPDLISRLKRKHPATRSQWIKTDKQDCKVWNPRPAPHEVATWTGDCFDGKLSGTGKLAWSYVKRGKSLQSSFEGQWKDGKPHGQGVLTKADGDRYEGQWKDGKKHGQGVFTYASGSRYKGQYRDGKKHGQGVYTGANGDRYEGQVKNDKPYGKGVYTFADGSRYEGYFIDGSPSGQGVFITKTGRREKRRWFKGCSAGKTNRAIGRSMKSCRF